MPRFRPKKPVRRPVPPRHGIQKRPLAVKRRGLKPGFKKVFRKGGGWLKRPGRGFRNRLTEKVKGQFSPEELEGIRQQAFEELRQEAQEAIHSEYVDTRQPETQNAELPAYKTNIQADRETNLKMNWIRNEEVNVVDNPTRVNRQDAMQKYIDENLESRIEELKQKRLKEKKTKSRQEE